MIEISRSRASTHDTFAQQDVEKVRQLCSRIVQRLNVLGVRFASSLAAAALDGHFEHPMRGLFVISHGGALVYKDPPK